MKLQLRRTDFSPHSTIGELSVDGIFECYTLEDVVRPDGIKIFGETAIPAGHYDVQMTFSPRFRRVLPLLVNVLGFVGVRIHTGNSAKDTEGCVLVGKSKATDWVSGSAAAFEPLFEKLSAASSRRDIISLDIS